MKSIDWVSLECAFAFSAGDVITFNIDPGDPVDPPDEVTHGDLCKALGFASTATDDQLIATLRKLAQQALDRVNASVREENGVLEREETLLAKIHHRDPNPSAWDLKYLYMHADEPEAPLAVRVRCVCEPFASEPDDVLRQFEQGTTVIEAVYARCLRLAKARLNYTMQDLACLADSKGLSR